MDPEWFYPERDNIGLANQAIVLCFGCPVRAECRAYKKKTKTKHGIWAGEFSKRDE